jgi:hypothetical protein
MSTEGKTMAGKASSSPTTSEPAPGLFFDGKAAAALQNAVLDAYEQAGRAWLDRVQSEVTLWSELATKLATTRSVSDAVEAYTKCMSQRIRLSLEDGQRLLNDSQQITQKITKALTNGATSRDGS